jgi:hypothetical protein
MEAEWPENSGIRMNSPGSLLLELEEEQVVRLFDDQLISHRPAQLV